MTNQFVPHTPEKIILVKISAREAHLLKILRKCVFGKIVVHKLNGLIMRAEPNESQYISEEEGLDMAVDITNK